MLRPSDIPADRAKGRVKLPVRRVKAESGLTRVQYWEVGLRRGSGIACVQLSFPR